MGSGNGVAKIYHHYERWEEHKYGMWLKPSKEEAEKLLPKVVEFTGNHIEYGLAMRDVVKKWRYSCEDKLTDPNINRRAWLGHAACCNKFKWPESLVREAWKHLSKKQQDLANAEADKTISSYIFFLNQLNQRNQLDLFDEKRNREIHKRLGEEVL